MRSSPHAGTHLVFRISASARVRSSAWSILMNHCLVARKMIGCLQRQQCGYEWRILSVVGLRRYPESARCWTMIGFASHTLVPVSSTSFPAPTSLTPGT